MKNKVHKSTSRWRAFKKLFIRPFYSIGKKQNVIIILGCQRSGTTLLTNVLDRIVYSKVFGEFSALSSSSPDKLRLNPLQDVVKKITNTRAPLIVMKPLVESQNALKLLEAIPNASIIWLYREYKDVILSNKHKFKSTAGYKNIKPFLDGDLNNWRSENASSQTIETLQTLYTESANEYDAGALFWYARNQLYFQQVLNKNNRVSLWSYEDFVQRPEEFIYKLLKDNNLPKPNAKIFDGVSTSSIGLASEIEVKSNINEKCTKLMQQLNDKKVVLN